jgi:hypothetical protein
MSVTSTPITTYAASPGTLLQDLVPANSTEPSMVPTSAHMNHAYTKRHQSYNQLENASAKDISDFIVRLRAESMRLSASGTTNPIMKARVDGLSEISRDMQTLLDELKKGIIKEPDIPVTKEELHRALPKLGNPSEPLPRLIKATGLPPGLANLLPSNMHNDPQTTREMGKLVDKYMDTIVNGVSASFEVKYTSPREAMKGQTKNMPCSSTIDKTGFPSLCDLDNISNAKFTPMDSGAVTDPMAPTPSDAGRGPSHFDWKKRAKDIEAQVKKRGLKSSDYGMMLPQTKVSEGFSWKGYARMMCTRLQATMDPNLPVTCGCPPIDWPGWRIAK